MVIDSLSDCELFHGVDPMALAALNLRPIRRRLSAGQVLFDRNDDTQDVWLVLSACLVVVFLTADGRELNFSLVGPGRYLGEVSAIDGQTRSLSVYARKSGEVLILSQADFHKAIDALPVVRGRVLRSMAGLIRNLTERSYQSVAMDVETRLRAFLVRQALEQNVLEPGGHIFEAPSHSEIADWIGANREAVSRAISFLKKSGVIDSGRRRLKILRPELLLEGLSA